jgi:hypothetical protein
MTVSHDPAEIPQLSSPIIRFPSVHHSEVNLKRVIGLRNRHGTETVT